MEANASDEVNFKESRKKPLHDRNSKPKVIIAPDGGWGWIVCFSCFMTHLLTDGLLYSFGVVFVELLDYFKGSKADTAFIPSLSNGFTFLIGPVAAGFINRFGCRAVTLAGTCVLSGSLIISIFAPNIYLLYFSFGVLTGIGNGLVYFAAIVNVTQYFDKRRSFATGLGVCGSVIGTFVFSPITKWLLDTYNWQGTLLIHAGLILNCVACGLVLLPIDHVNSYVDEKEETQLAVNVFCISTIDLNTQVVSANANKVSSYDDNDGVAEDGVVDDDEINIVNITKAISDHNMADKNHNPKNTNNKEKSGTDIRTSIKGSFHIAILKNKAFAMFTISMFFYTLGFYIPYIYLPDKAKNAGIDDYKGAWFLSSAGISSTVGRVVFGFISDRKCVSRLYLYSPALVFCRVATSFGTFFYSFESLLIYSVLFGLFSGVSVSLMSVVLADIVGVERMPDAFGVRNFFAGIAALIGPPIADTVEVERMPDDTFGDSNFFAGIAVFIGSPIAGWLFEVTGSYDAPFVVTGVTSSVLDINTRLENHTQVLEAIIPQWKNVYEHLIHMH